MTCVKKDDGKFYPQLYLEEMFYVRNIHIRSYTINKVTFVITSITTAIIIIIIIIIFNFNITIIIIIIIIITIVIKSTTVIIFILSFTLHVFDNRSSCVTFIFKFNCVFLTTCFLLFVGFRCNILLTNISIYPLLLALVVFKNFSTFNKHFPKIIMWYNFNCRLVSDLYILFQFFQAVLITQKLGSNLKYQLHCIVACVIIITLNRSLNLKWLINLSSFILFKLANLIIKNYSKFS